MTVRVITPPAAYPVTMQEAKDWAHILGDDSQDSVLDILLAGMVEHAEDHVTGRAFVERTLEWSGDYFPGCIELPYPPLIAVESVKYTDANGNEQTVLSSSYEVDTTTEPGRIRASLSAFWPSVGRYYNPARIRYRAGYRPLGSPTDLTDNSYLPAKLRLWIAARIVTLFDQRGHLIDGREVQIPRDFADGMLDSLIVGSRLF